MRAPVRPLSAGYGGRSQLPAVCRTACNPDTGIRPAAESSPACASIFLIYKIRLAASLSPSRHKKIPACLGHTGIHLFYYAIIIHPKKPLVKCFFAD